MNGVKVFKYTELFSSNNIYSLMMLIHRKVVCTSDLIAISVCLNFMWFRSTKLLFLYFVFTLFHRHCISYRIIYWSMTYTSEIFKTIFRKEHIGWCLVGWWMFRFLLWTLTCIRNFLASCKMRLIWSHIIFRDNFIWYDGSENN